MLMELQDTVGKMLLLFLSWCLVMPSILPLSSSTPRLDSSPSVYGEDVAKDALSWGQVHFRGAGGFCIKPPKGWRIREGCIEARERRRGGTGFMNECHEWLQSSKQLENLGALTRPNIEREGKKKRMETVINQIKVKLIVVFLIKATKADLAEY